MSSMSSASENGERVRGFGVAGALPEALIRELAAAAERAGYRSFWVNDTPSGDGLASLRHAAEVTSRIRLAVGVIPLDRQAPKRVADRVAALELPGPRLTLGIGAGSAPDGLERVRAGVLALREATTATIIVGALGPKMCRIAGDVADGVLLNWLTPEHARRSSEVVAASAAAAHRFHPQVDGYVRTALGAAAIARLHDEGERYEAIPAYAAHFARMEADPPATAATGSTADEIQDALAPFDAVLDETVVRAITREESATEYLALLHAAAPN